MKIFRIATVSFAIAATSAFCCFAQAATPELSRADYDACQAENPASLRSAIEAVTLKALTAGTARLELGPILEREWRESGIDDIINTRVDLAVAEVSEETSLAGHLKSLASREKAKELATAVAERVFRSEPVQKAIEQVSVNVSKSIGNSIDIVTADAAGPVSNCLSAFLGPRYGATVARSITREATSAFVVKPG